MSENQIIQGQNNQQPSASKRFTDMVMKQYSSIGPAHEFTNKEKQLISDSRGMERHRQIHLGEDQGRHFRCWRLDQRAGLER